MAIFWTFSSHSVGTIQILAIFDVDWYQNHAKTWSGGRFLIMDNFFLIEFNVRDVLESLVLKNASQRASQHVKRTSGARVMIIGGRSVYDRRRSLGRSVAQSLAWSLARSLGRSPSRSLAQSLDRSVAPSVARSLTRSLARSMARLVGRSLVF